MADADQVPEQPKPEGLKWFVSVPVWGDWHREIFRKFVFPRHQKLGLEGCTYVVHTDDIGKVEFVKDLPCEVIFRSKKGESYQGMNQCHGEVLSMAQGHGILFLPPDCIPSTNAFMVVKKSVGLGKKLVMTASLRTFGSEDVPEESKGLNDWAIEHLHPNQFGWIWGHKKGINLTPSNIYFREGWNFWCHGAHLHPIAAVLDRKIGGGKSIDSYLAGAYTEEETWIVSDSELAMCEITHRDKFSGLEDAPLSVSNCIRRLKGKVHEHNKRFMLQRIALRGKAGDFSVPIIQEILKGLKD